MSADDLSPTAALSRQPCSFTWRGKRLMDVLLAAALLIALAPLMALTALAIRLESPGPVLFRQRRTGLGGAPFTIFKLRTMAHGRTHPAFPPPDALQGIQAALDPRNITRLGRILRATRLDETPQLLNVLRGDMALVGPRPHVPELDAAFREALPAIDLRHAVKPGLTGLAQARGLCGPIDSEATMAARLAADLEYVRRQSPWLDLLILARTPLATLRASLADSGALRMQPRHLRRRPTHRALAPLHRGTAREPA